MCSIYYYRYIYNSKSYTKLYNEPAVLALNVRGEGVDTYIARIVVYNHTIPTSAMHYKV